MRIILSVFLLFVTACDGSNEPAPEVLEQPGNGLEEQLARAEPGDVVRLDPETDYTGTFTVPAGVTLAGEGATLHGEGPVVLRVVTAPGLTTVVRDLEIENAGVGLVVTGGGEVEISGVTVAVTAGAGIVAEGLQRLELRDVQVLGNLTDGDLGSLGARVDPAQFAVVGIAVSEVPEVLFVNTDVHRIAGLGVV